MEDIYHLDKNCLNELSYLIISNKILLSFSISLKAIQTCFFLRRTFTSNNQSDISKFESVRELNFVNRTQLVNLTAFQNLERLIFSKYIYKLNIGNHSKLTYLVCNQTLDVNFVQCTNLKHLKCNYIKSIESLIYLQSLECKFEKFDDTMLDFSIFSHLTKLHMIDNVFKYDQYQKIEIPFSTKLIDLHASQVDFSNKLLLGDGLKYLNLSRARNVLFSSLKSVKSIYFEDVKNITVSTQENSFCRLLKFTVKTIDKFSFNLCNMTNLTSFNLCGCKEIENINLSFLTSLQRMKFDNNTKNCFNIVLISIKITI